MQYGQRGMRVKRVQEWLTFHGFATVIDSDFGPATRTCVRRFQAENGSADSGIVDEATWNAMIVPLTNVLAPIAPAAGDTLPSMLLKYADQHLIQHPVELGGENSGVWVRIYMNGNEGSEWFWCAGFATFIMKQACQALDLPMPIQGSFSCDSLAYQAQMAGLFVPGKDIEQGIIDTASLGAAQMFLVRRTSTDWTHTGFSFSWDDHTFSTIEGNTNDEGSSNGYEVCERYRSIKDKDFIIFVE
jgi:hypothetical protein